MPPERLLLCGGRPLNTEPEAGALEITVLRVSEIAPAILIMSSTLIPYVHWLQAQREKEREKASSVPCSHLPISCPHSLLLVTWNSTSIANTLMCFMSQCLSLGRRCVEYYPISHSKWILCLGNHLTGPLLSDVERRPVLQSRWLVCACREYVYIHSKLSPFDIYMLQRGSRTRPCNKDMRGLLAARQKPHWYMSKSRQGSQSRWCVPHWGETSPPDGVALCVRRKCWLVCSCFDALLDLR